MTRFDRIHAIQLCAYSEINGNIGRESQIVRTLFTHFNASVEGIAVGNSNANLAQTTRMMDRSDQMVNKLDMRSKIVYGT